MEHQTSRNGVLTMNYMKRYKETQFTLVYMAAVHHTVQSLMRSQSLPLS